MNLEDLQVVLKVAEFRSITGAATSLDMRVATASAAIKRVEAMLGFELFIRSTRRLRLSNEGERYIPQCEQALQMLENAKQGTKENLDIVDGEIRIAISSDLGRNIVIPWLDEFMQKHPNVSLKVNISDSNIDFYRDSVDVALRYGSPDDASLYGFKICDIPGLLCASPDYLKRCGTPEHPQDLAAHNGLFYQLYDVTHDVWTFTASDPAKDRNEYKIKMKGDRSSNDGDLVRRWCVAGKGLAVKSCLDVSNDLLSGKVVNVMPDYNARATQLWLVCPSRQLITPAVRLLRDEFRARAFSMINLLATKEIVDQQTI